METVKKTPQELVEMGYISISNKYRMIGRIDRKDWLTFLARQMQCAVADFYNVDGSGVDKGWEEQYIRVYTRDKMVLNEWDYSEFKRIRHGYF